MLSVQNASGASENDAYLNCSGEIWNATKTTKLKCSYDINEADISNGYNVIVEILSSLFNQWHISLHHISLFAKYYITCLSLEKIHYLYILICDWICKKGSSIHIELIELEGPYFGTQKV